jgi:hypothetical protein
MPDLFGAPKTNGHNYLAPIDDPFRWIVAVFAQGSATRAIIKANSIHLATFYPLRFNKQGEPVPLWSNYLFLEYREFISIELCRETPHFIRLISARDPDSDLMQPVMVRRNAVAENMRMLMEGKFNDVAIQRQFHGKGSLVMVTEGSFVSREVRLEIDVTPPMRGGLKVPISIDGVKAVIELHKLAL